VVFDGFGVWKAWKERKRQKEGLESTRVKED
jgi:hypothetical protein